jgi:hypothetical protein
MICNSTFAVRRCTLQGFSSKGKIDYSGNSWKCIIKEISSFTCQVQITRRSAVTVQGCNTAALSSSVLLSHFLVIFRDFLPASPSTSGHWPVARIEVAQYLFITAKVYE